MNSDKDDDDEDLTLLPTKKPPRSAAEIDAAKAQGKSIVFLDYENICWVRDP
jgi:hypothetical protein